MTTMLHSEFDYNTASLKRAIQLGEAKPSTRHGTTTVFPLGLPQDTRDRLMTLSTLTGEPMAQIIRQAIAKILAEGPAGVIRTSEIRATAVAAERAGEAAVRAEREELASQEKAALRAQRAAKKAEKTEVVPVPTLSEPSIPSVLDQIMESSETDNHQLDRPEPPTPQHIWVRGSANRWGGYWRAPKGQRTV